MTQCLLYNICGVVRVMKVKELKSALVLLPDDMPIGLNIFVSGNNYSVDVFSNSIKGIIIDDEHRIYINSLDGEIREKKVIT